MEEAFDSAHSGLGGGFAAHLAAEFGRVPWPRCPARVMGRVGLLPAPAAAGSHRKTETDTVQQVPAFPATVLLPPETSRLLSRAHIYDLMKTFVIDHQMLIHSAGQYPIC